MKNTKNYNCLRLSIVVGLLEFILRKEAKMRKKIGVNRKGMKEYMRS